MNKIKDSFSKIKASDEFKDKLSRELLNISNKSKPTKRKLYFRPSIAAAILLMLMGIISFKLIINPSEKGSTNLDSIAYSPKEEPQINENSIKKEDQDNKDPLSSTEDVLPAITSTDEIKPQSERSSNDNNFVYEESVSDDVNSNVTENVDSNVSKNVVASTNEKTPSINDVSNDNKNVDSNNINAFDSNASVNSVYIPKIQFPEAQSKALTTARMMPLIAYKGNVYIYTPIEIASENAKNLLGRKLGTTKGNIDEWSTQSDYSNEFVSNIGVTDVYAVNGYDEDFRIMTNIKIEDGTSYPEFYECLNGITIKNGEDILSKLKLQGNIARAKFQTFNDWNNSTGIFYTINDIDLLNNFFDEINKSTPYLPEDIEDSLGDYRNDDEYKEISFDLKDGSKNITFTVLKDGYVYYGYPRIYLKIDDNFTAELWDKLGIMKINFN